MAWKTFEETIRRGRNGYIEAWNVMNNDDDADDDDYGDDDDDIYHSQMSLHPQGYFIMFLQKAEL